MAETKTPDRKELLIQKIENEIEFSTAAAHQCGLKNLNQLYWQGRVNGLTAALNLIKQDNTSRMEP